MVLTNIAGEQHLPRWFETFFELLQRLKIGTIEVSLPDGRIFAVYGALAGPIGRIDVANPAFFTRLARDGDIGFPEMYMEEWWDSPDLQALLDVLLLNNESVAGSFMGAALVRVYERMRHWLRSNTRRGAQRNIAQHYDLGNEFYGLWLDETMTYSSALFSGQGGTLRDAQQNKYAAICDRMGLRRGDHILEIGCGWGGFAEYAISERGAQITGLTLSQEQCNYAQQRLFKAGLAERARIVMRDYRDESGVYDGIASIEMFEAVGEKYWPAYFQTVRERLRSGRIASLQIITIADPLFNRYRRGSDFIQKYIFPGGMLPSPLILRKEFAAAGLEICSFMELPDSYSRTLREWRATFNSRWEEITILGFDGRFHRMWNFYLAVCAAGFNAGTISVSQFGLRITP